MALDKNDLKQIEAIVDKAGIRLDGKFDKIDHKIDKVEARLDKRIDNFGAKVDSLDKKIDSVSTSLDKKIDSVSTSLDKKIDSVYCSLNDKIDSSNHGLRVSMAEMEKRISATITREISDLVEINRAVINEFGRVDDHEKRIVRLEAKIGSR